MKHYVYRITNTKLNKHYYGVRSAIDPKLDLGIKYFSSSSDIVFMKDQKIEPLVYKYKILGVYATRAQAIEKEIRLHEKFNVGVNPSFYNKAKQTHRKFDCTGTQLSIEHKRKIGAKHKGKLVSSSTKMLISQNHADVSGENNPRFGVVGAMTGKVSVVSTDGVKSLISSEAYQNNKHLYTLTVSLTKRVCIEVTCPHCSKVGKGPNMTRYHFDNCKLK